MIDSNDKRLCIKKIVEVEKDIAIDGKKRRMRQRSDYEKWKKVIVTGHLE